jgi:DNA-directed RNA polymerase subunit RPC12/RpoP
MFMDAQVVSVTWTIMWVVFAAANIVITVAGTYAVVRRLIRWSNVLPGVLSNPMAAPKTYEFHLQNTHPAAPVPVRAPAPKVIVPEPEEMSGITCGGCGNVVTGDPQSVVIEDDKSLAVYNCPHCQSILKEPLD